MNKKEALTQIVELMHQYRIDIREIALILKQDKPSALAEGNISLNKLYSYIGSIIIFAGVYALIAMNWENFNLYQRIILTLGFGFSSYILAFLCLKFTSYQRAAPPLLLIALFLEPSGLIILLQEYNVLFPMGWILFIGVIYFVHQLLAIKSDKPLIIVLSTLIFGLIVYSQANESNRIILNLGFGFFMFLLGLYYHQKPYKISTSFFVIGALLEASGIFTLLSQYSVVFMSTWGILLVSLVLFLQYAIAFISIRLTALAFMALIFLYSFFLIALELLGVPYRLKWLILSSSLLLISMFINHSRYKVIAGVLFFISSLTLFLVSFDILRNHSFEVLYLGLSCGLIYIAIIEGSKALLLNSSLATLCFVLYFSSKHFPNAIGWPITLILIGVLFIGFSGIVLKINKKYMS